MNLVADIGNTFTKLGIFKNDHLVKSTSLESCNKENILDFFSDVDEKVRNVIVSSVREIPADLNSFFNDCFKNYFVLSHELKLPFKSTYTTPQSLGADRMAISAAAMKLFPNINCLCIDMGTCITYDFIDRHEVYHGGAISPGVNMRFRAMHNFTGRLPLVISTSNLNELKYTGNSTENSMLSGVYKGVLAEIHDRIEHYESNYNNLQVLITGGDYLAFEKHLKKSIFADPNLVLVGLNKILSFNLEV